jgi:hypothetical protein
MVDAVARELAITYGGLTVGGAQTKMVIHDRFQHSRDSEALTAHIAFDLLITGTTTADFVQRCQLVETAFSQPYKACVGSVGSTLMFAYSDAPVDLCYPKIEKSGEEIDTGRSRLYKVSIDVQRKSRDVSTAGLHEFSVDISEIASQRRTLTIGGAFTAASGSGARAAYEAAIDTLASSIISDIGGTFERISTERADRDITDHKCEFSVVYRELIFNQLGGSPDNAAVIEQSVVIRRERFGADDSDRLPSIGGGGGGTSGSPGASDVRRMERLNVTYNAWVQKDTDPHSLWPEPLRTFLSARINEIKEEGDGMAIIEESHDVSPDDNRLSARMVVMIAVSDVIERRTSVHDNDADDQRLVKIWDGKRFSRHVYDVPTDLTRTVTERSLMNGDYSLTQARSRARELRGSLQGDAGTRDPGGQWTRGVMDVTVTPLRRGLHTDGVSITEVSISIRYQHYAAGSKAGRGGTRRGPTSGGGGSPRPHGGTPVMDGAGGNRA